MTGRLRQLLEPRLRQQAGIEKSQTLLEREVFVQWVSKCFLLHRQYVSKGYYETSKHARGCVHLHICIYLFYKLFVQCFEISLMSSIWIYSWISYIWNKDVPGALFILMYINRVLNGIANVCSHQQLLVQGLKSAKIWKERQLSHPSPKTKRENNHMHKVINFYESHAQ